MTDYERFIQENGCKYKDEESLKAAYDRAWKAAHHIVLTEEEFLLEANRKDAAAARTFRNLLKLFEERRITAATIYRYAKFSWCMKNPEAVIAYEGDHDRWYVNNCDAEITEEEAIVKVNKEWGFEASRVSIVGKPYYDATDWQFVRFNCAGVAWLWANGNLEKVYGN